VYWHQLVAKIEGTHRDAVPGVIEEAWVILVESLA